MDKRRVGKPFGKPAAASGGGAGRPLRRDAPRIQPRLDLDDVIYGIHAVEEALAAGEELKKIHVGNERRSDPALRNLLALARERELTVRFDDRAFFNAFPYKAHQSVVAFGTPFDYTTVEELIALPRTGPALFVILDHVTDPHNVGAIVRTAECAGATGMILPDRRSAGINATVRKAAAGAASYLPIARVANVANTIRMLKKARIWVAGAALGATAVAYTKADLKGDLALVIGAEGDGLSPLVARECDYLVTIPIEGKTESLNASVAAAILLYEALRQRTAT
jgi:23S rRNA (guanosine2251-2'-O)-methyltransferase